MSTARVQASQDDYGKLAELICMDAEIIGRLLSMLCMSSGGNKGKRESKIVSSVPPGLRD